VHFEIICMDISQYIFGNRAIPRLSLHRKKNVTYYNIINITIYFVCTYLCRFLLNLYCYLRYCFKFVTFDKFRLISYFKSQHLHIRLVSNYAAITLAHGVRTECCSVSRWIVFISFIKRDNLYEFYYSQPFDRY